MRAVSFGVTLGSFGAGLVPPPGLVEWAAEIERLALDTLWYRDHVLWHSPVLDPFTVLGAFAARTSRIRLGPGVLLLPLRHPVVVAQAVSSLDAISGGRAVLGIGVGGEFPAEYRACGVALAERGRRADEALEAIRILWTEAPAAYRGTFFTFEGVALQPRPVQRPGPPVWVGGRSAAALRRAARLGDGWLAIFMTPERFRESLGRILEQRDALADGNGGAFRAGLVLYVCLDRTREAARRAAANYLAAEYRQAFDHLVERYCALGTADDCAETIGRFIEAGADHISLIPTRGPDAFLDDLRAVVTDVLPRCGAR